jgi:hypothetical protein
MGYGLLIRAIIEHLFTFTQIPPPIKYSTPLKKFFIKFNELPPPPSVSAMPPFVFWLYAVVFINSML